MQQGRYPGDAKGLPFVRNDGGREAAGYKGNAGDCVTRAIAIATGLPYQQVYDALSERASKLRGRDKKVSARDGVSKKAYRPYLESLGWEWKPLMQIGSGCVMRLKPDEIPAGRVVARVSKHLCAVIDGVLHDTWDCSEPRDFCEPDNGQDLKASQWRNPNGIWTRNYRCVYGYFRQKEK